LSRRRGYWILLDQKFIIQMDVSHLVPGTRQRVILGILGSQGRGELLL
jgi:hypothetical protein